MPNIREQIADTITGGQLTEARNAVTSLTGQYHEILSETRRLTRDIDLLKEGGTLAESYTDCTWNNRLALDQHWQLISGYAQHRQIRKSDVDLYNDLVHYAYHFSPLVQGAIDLKTRYTFGLSYSITSGDDLNQSQIDEIINDPRNRLAVFGSQATLGNDRELQKGGNIYLAIWLKKNPVQIRVWSAYEIGDILAEPEDADTPLYYIRTMPDGKTKAYPSIYNTKHTGIVNQDGVSTTVDKDIVVYHMAEGKELKQKWALSPYAGALRWNRAYEGFLLDFAAIVEMIRKYSTMFTTMGDGAQVDALKTQFDHEQHGHHKYQIGDQLITTAGNDFKVIDAGSSKIVGLSDARVILLQFCTAVGIPSNLLIGDPQTGNRASAQELTTNFLPLIEERQTMWTEAFKAIFTHILDSDEFEVSFPPLRSQDALTYLQSLTNTAIAPATGTLTGLVRPEDLIRAVYEALDLKLPEDTDIDEMVAALLEKVSQDPMMAQAIDRLAIATEQMKKGIFREADDEGTWVTVNGQHILIGDDGNIKTGPMAGKSPDQAFGGKGDGGEKGKSGSGGTGKSNGGSGERFGSSNAEDSKVFSKSEKVSIEKYRSISGNQYGQINEYCRTGKGDSEVKGIVTQIDSAIAKAPKVPKGTVLYRGLSEKQGKALLSAKVGDSFKQGGFQSYSLDRSQADGFSKAGYDSKKGWSRTVLKIEGDDSFKGIHIGSKEAEVLLDRGQTYTITGHSVEKTKGSLTKIHVITVKPSKGG